MLEAIAGKLLVEGAKAAVEKTVETGKATIQKTFSLAKDSAKGGIDNCVPSIRESFGKIPSFAKEQLSGGDVSKRCVASDENIPRFYPKEFPRIVGQDESGDVVDADPHIPRFEEIQKADGNPLDPTVGSETEGQADADAPSGEIRDSSDADRQDSATGEIDDADAVSDENSEIEDSRLDDNGTIYKDENGELLPNSQYEINGTTYTTDDKGRIISAEGYLKDTPDNDRDNAAQSDAGGKDRKPGDDGGHLRARMNGGSSGNENLVAMRDTINRGDYKRSENEENQMLKDGKQVYEKIEVTYDDDSSRPSKIEKTYTDGEKTVKVTVDNIEGSTDLVETLEGDISEQNLGNLRNEIEDMKADGNEVSVTSVRREYDSDGNLKSVTVCVTNETTGEKGYTTYSPNNGGKESNG